MAKPVTTHAFKLAPDDDRLLAALVAHERLTVSDVIRRALRAYAAQLGVKVTKPRLSKTAP